MYIDTSLVVPYYCHEALSRAAERTLRGDARPALSDLVEVEFFSALARKVRMRAFAGAARDFYAAAPWRHLSDEDLIHVETPTVDRAFRRVTVLGRAGQTFGLGFFASPEDLDKLRASPDPEMFLEGGGRWTVVFGPPWETPFSDLGLWEELGEAWKATTGALEWLATHAPARKRRKRHQR